MLYSILIYGTDADIANLSKAEEERLIGQHIVVVVSPPYGEQVDATALTAELRRQLPLYMVPRQILVRPEIPRSPNGKFDRNLLRRELDS
jgi:acyl-CoA synthetase (AMP-forming)/AMP-acid ligase II